MNQSLCPLWIISDEDALLTCQSPIRFMSSGGKFPHYHLLHLVTVSARASRANRLVTVLLFGLFFVDLEVLAQSVVVIEVIRASGSSQGFFPLLTLVFGPKTELNRALLSSH